MGFSRRLRPSASAARHWRRGLPQVKNVAARLRAAAGRAPISRIEVARVSRCQSQKRRRPAKRRPTRRPRRSSTRASSAVCRSSLPLGEAVADGLDETARKEALVQALAARASRFAEAVDDALTLANDGAIRWLGDPVGKLIAGAGPLEPGATLLADEALPPEGREAAERRLSLWLAAHLHKVLGPLIALADAQVAPEAARSIALKVVAGARRAGARARQGRGQGARPGSARRLAQARRSLRRPLHLCPGAAEAGGADAVRAIVGVGSAQRRPGRGRATAALRRFGADILRRRAARLGRTLSHRRLPPVRRSGGAGRHRRTAVRSDPRRAAALADAGAGRRGRRLRRHRADDLADRLLGRAVRVDPAFARLRRPRGQEVGPSGGDRAPRRAPRPRPPLPRAPVAEVVVPPAAEGEAAPAAADPSRPRSRPRSKNRRSSRPPPASTSRRKSKRRPSLSQPRSKPAVVEAAGSIDQPSEVEPRPSPSRQTAAPLGHEPAVAESVSEVAAPPAPSSPRASRSRRRSKARIRRRPKRSSLRPKRPAEAGRPKPSDRSRRDRSGAGEEETIEVWRPAPRRPRHAPHHHRHRDHHPQLKPGGRGRPQRAGRRARQEARAPRTDAGASRGASARRRGTRRRKVPAVRPPPASRAATRSLAKAGAARRNGAATRPRRAIAATIAASATRRRSGPTRAGRGRRRSSRASRRASTSTRRSPSCSSSSRCCRGATRTNEAVRGGRDELIVSLRSG